MGTKKHGEGKGFKDGEEIPVHFTKRQVCCIKLLIIKKDNQHSVPPPILICFSQAKKTNNRQSKEKKTSPFKSDGITHELKLDTLPFFLYRCKSVFGASLHTILLREGFKSGDI